jgi:predicted NBD/HSP70 family sugar kinase
MRHAPFAPDSPGAVLELIRSGVATSRSDVARLTGVSASTAAGRVQALIDHGYLREAGDGKSHGGRRPRQLELRTEAGMIGAVDLGSHHATVALLDFGGRILAEREVQMDIADGPSMILARASAHIRSLQEELDTDAPAGFRPPYPRYRKTRRLPLHGIVVGVPGPVDARAGRVVSHSRMPGWHGTNAGTMLTELANTTVLVENDANLMALGELHSSSAQHLVLVKAGTGIGCGVIASGRLHRGGVGAAGDISHLAVHGFADVACSCGRNGCLDTVASGAALVRDLNAAGVKVRDTAEVVALASDAEPTVTRMLRAAGRSTGEVLATIVNFFNPEVLVIGGQLSRADAFVASIRSTLYERCLPMATEHLQIVTTRTGRLAGVLGGGQLMLEYLFDPERVNAAVDQKT